MAQLALNHDQRHTFAGHLNGVSVAELVRREAAPNTGRSGRAIGSSGAPAPRP